MISTLQEMRIEELEADVERLRSERNARQSSLEVAQTEIVNQRAEIMWLQAIANACVEFNTIRPLPMAIMEPVYRWREAAEAGGDD